MKIKENIKYLDINCPEKCGKCSGNYHEKASKYGFYAVSRAHSLGAISF